MTNRGPRDALHLQQRQTGHGCLATDIPHPSPHALGFWDGNPTQPTGLRPGPPGPGGQRAGQNPAGTDRGPPGRPQARGKGLHRDGPQGRHPERPGEWAPRRGLAETGSSLPDQKGKPLPKDPPCAGSSSSASGCAWWSWRAGPWSSTWPPITRPRCACWGHSDITSWSEGGAECGFKTRLSFYGSKPQRAT